MEMRKVRGSTRLWTAAAILWMLFCAVLYGYTGRLDWLLSISVTAVLLCVIWFGEKLDQESRQRLDHVTSTTVLFSRRRPEVGETITLPSGTKLQVTDVGGKPDWVVTYHEVEGQDED